MGRPQRENACEKWVSLREAAALTGYTYNYLREKIRRDGFPEQHKRPGSLGITELDFPKLFAWFVSESTAKALLEQDPDLVDGGSNSPNLERLRKLKGDQAEMQIAHMRRDVVPREQWRGLLMTCAGYVRDAGDILRRRFGNEAGQVLDGAIDRMEETIEKELGE